MWVSRNPSPVCCRPIQNVGDGRDAVADGVADIHDAAAAERREDGVVERALAARSAHWMETWASMRRVCQGAIGDAPSAQSWAEVLSDAAAASRF